MIRRDVLRIGAAGLAALSSGFPARATAQGRARMLAVPAVDRLVVTNVVDSVYDAFAKGGKLDGVTVERKIYRAGEPSLLAEHGLAYHLASELAGERRELLLDFSLTGTALIGNYRALGVDPARADALILSYGHADRYGGLLPLVRAARGSWKDGIALYAGGNDTFCPRVLLAATGERVDQGQLDRTELERLGVKIVIATQPVLVAGHAVTSGEIPRITAFERPPAGARLLAGPPDSPCAGILQFPVPSLRVAAPQGALITDNMKGEQALGYLVRDRGLVAITSGGYAGMINTVRQLIKVSGAGKVHAVIGGLHLGLASDEVLGKTIEELKRIDPDYVVPAYSTSLRAILALQREMPNKLVMPSAGTRLIFGA